ncbi:glycogen debranching enzyme-like isoform X1 [Pollicipes pollicipes]|uniref:glycogen debranching enzyme-like isoform X1 n=2 Tax=Pollicipes pollicipes TaxID=41117 RepID=UPI001884D84B|nr:glycogen debranching enzyme-like isoform X1 [Pollicipes pollicipes]XP_037086527.1 glycogen debranching enzyme-like isoform X1 [Pollicipes pollicipes]XP_037086528.1 glycogen debranching enzyme-like isoform X1 [Pollicipes pollicipes]
MATRAAPAMELHALDRYKFSCSYPPLFPGMACQGTGDDPEVRVLKLHDDHHQEATLYRLQKGFILHFRLGPSLFGRVVSVFSNHPASADEEFSRDKYRLLPWKSDSKIIDDTSIFVEVPIVRAGSFRYYFTHTEGSDPNPRGSGYFVVDPTLSRGSNNEVLGMDCILSQTVLSKCLGPLDQWEGRLEVARQTGYNMVHFTPVQELGGSNSAYSLANQLRLNPAFQNSDGSPATIEDLAKLIKKMRDEWKMLSVCDIVLNHSANESPWLREHPECGYNLVNSGHLRPAYLLDRLVDCLARDMLQGKWKERGLPEDVTEEGHLAVIRDLLHGEYLPHAKLHEFYQCNPASLCDQLGALCTGESPPPDWAEPRAEPGQLRLLPDPNGVRFGRRVDLHLAKRIFFDSGDVNQAKDHLRSRLMELNDQAASIVQGHLSAAVENIISGIRYERLADHGPKMRGITWRTPLVAPYFTTLDGAKSLDQKRSLEEEEAIMFGADACLLMAHNGWVMGDDPLSDFARPGSDVYLRRELIAWGDSIKLRYGDRPDDCPFLWQHMRRYAEQVARVFHGIRLDNCHSTPINVAEYMLDAARKVRPDLYVIAELFTNNDQTDNIFVNRLGINSLIREAMSAGNSHELGRLVYLYGGEPVGSFLKPHIRPLAPARSHAIFMDLTHDNPCPVTTRSPFDALVSAGLVYMACCAAGSNRGYDELVPHHIHVVTEKRMYSSWGDGSQSGQVDVDSGIIRGKQVLGKLHYEMGRMGFTQVYVDQVTEDIVTITRHNPVNHQSYVLCAHTAFRPPGGLWTPDGIKALRIQGTVAEVVFEARVVPRDGRPMELEDIEQSDTFIDGVNQYRVDLRESFGIEDSSMLSHRLDNGYTVMDYKDFPPGSMFALRIAPCPLAVGAVEKLRSIVCDLTQFSLSTDIEHIIGRLTLADMNRIIYRCDQEERDEGRGWAAYDLPNFGPLVYSGFQSIMSLMSEIRVQNDLGHALCENLRQGDWLMDYVVGRLKLEPTTMELANWLEDTFDQIRQMPRYLVPAYFDATLLGVYVHLLNSTWRQMARFVREGSEFTKDLAMGSIQMGGLVHSSPLPEISSNLAPPRPATWTRPDGVQGQACVSLAAGLPHFSTGYMRNWGRDTFIALRGLFTITGRHAEARYIILAFAGCLRHGLIPNLLDGGKNARFNCRDAVWWWLYCIQEYVRLVSGGVSILQDKVSRLYPTDDSPPLETGEVEQPLHDVIQEALQRHFEGLSFRERNAGPQIDRDMSDQGFNNQIGVDMETGFVFGGNGHNCGTWMDKMGSSERSGNKGKPATPRDGSAVELVGLSRSTVAWLAGMYRDGKYPYEGVKKTDENGTYTSWKWEEWADMIDKHFEKLFYIHHVPHPQFEPVPELINIRGMYKDSYCASQFWADYQLRCNFPIAMVAAPDMFNPNHAWTALETADRLLLGPMGMKTLAACDWAYDGVYNVDDDGTDPKKAHGFSYHNGPEWVWPLGFYLRARLHFAPLIGGHALLQSTITKVKQIISKHYVQLSDSVWRSLPELTNMNGEFCKFSCQAQAWSMGCILEVLHDIKTLEEQYKGKVQVLPPATVAQ